VEVGVARTGHPEAPEIVPSVHCLLRFRQRTAVRSPGGGEAARALLEALAAADVTHWPPAWAVTDRPAALWAVNGDLAFPLARTNTPGRWLAVTCLRRGGRA
jgi:hypothetical protein